MVKCKLCNWWLTATSKPLSVVECFEKNDRVSDGAGDQGAALGDEKDRRKGRICGMGFEPGSVGGGSLGAAWITAFDEPLGRSFRR